MKHIFKSKNKYHKKILSKITFFTIILIILFTLFLLINFNQNLNKTAIDISNKELNNLLYSIVTERINNHVLNEETLKDILIINKNKDDEILYVDFNLDNAYKVLDKISNVLTSSLKETKNGNIAIGYYNKELSHTTNSLILNIPIGSLLKSLYFYNLGPKIPIKINFIGSLLTNLETKITNYGLNNALVEVYVYTTINCEILSPFNKNNVSLKYDSVIASLMVEGKVPNFYDGSIEKNSAIYSKSYE